jgi:predicted RNase H-like HicB family nuclease
LLAKQWWRFYNWNIVTQGDSVEDAKNNLVEAVGLFLGTCIEMGNSAR